MSNSTTNSNVFTYKQLVTRATSLLLAMGVSEDSASLTADGLVEADARGLPSHGLMLLPMYLDRIKKGSINPTATNELVTDLGALAVFDSHHGLGHSSAQYAMESAIEKAKNHGIAAVVCRNAFHFGGAYRYSKMAASAGMVGVAAANTRPLMPAPGGSKAVVGNNPIGFAVPTSGETPVVFDMALSEVAMGKIRLADAEGKTIPNTWATDSSGIATTDPAEAIKGMLLPAGGTKGFGLALVIDMLTGVLSGGGFGSRVNGLYANLEIPYNSANFFLAIDASRLDSGFQDRALALANEVLNSPMSEPGSSARLPGQRSEENYQRSLTEGVWLDESVIRSLLEWEQKLNTVGSEG